MVTVTHSDRIRLLIVSPQCDANDVGESWAAYHWISRLGQKCDVTLLTLSKPGRELASEQLPHVRVIEWPPFPNLTRCARFKSMVKPWYPSFYARVRRWIREASNGGEQFDLIHHLTPVAMRYPSPCVGLGIPYVIGPQSGSLPTPPSFKRECKSAPIYTHLRNLDAVRFRYDPWLRRTYTEAEVVICSSPYVKDRLSAIPLRRAEIICEVGVPDLGPRRPEQVRKTGELRLLHIGRAVRTKGLRDAIRALAVLPDLPDVSLVAAGDGEELELCRREAKALGIADRVRLLGRVTHHEVDKLYAEADVLLFPSFREPTGIVLFEAMRLGLPVITTDRGGPGYIVDDSCGIRVPVRDPQEFARDIASAIRVLASDKDRLAALGDGARRRVEAIGLWPNKIDTMLSLYHQVIPSARRTETRESPVEKPD